MGSDCRVPRIAGVAGPARFRCRFDAQVISEVMVKDAPRSADTRGRQIQRFHRVAVCARRGARVGALTNLAGRSNVVYDGAHRSQARKPHVVES